MDYQEQLEPGRGAGGMGLRDPNEIKRLVFGILQSRQERGLPNSVKDLSPEMFRIIMQMNQDQGNNFLYDATTGSEYLAPGVYRGHHIGPEAAPNWREMNLNELYGMT